MITTLQIILLVIMGLFVLTALGNMLNLGKYGIHFFPLGVMFKTEFFNKVLEKMGEKGKRFWKVIYNIGKVLAGLIALGFLVYFLVNPFLLLFNSPAGLGIQLIIPGVTMDFKVALLFILPFVLVIIPHEIAHAVMAKREGLEIKASGIFILLVLFGGFVEIAKESMEKATSKSKIKVWMNGSAINAIFALFFLILYLLSPYIISIGYGTSNGVLITNIFENSPAEESGLQKGDVIQQITLINESAYPINVSIIENVDDYYTLFTSNFNSNKILISLLNGSHVEATPTNINPNTNTTSTSQLYLGINIDNYLPPKGKRLSVWFPYYWNIEVSYTLNLSVMAVFLNLLPLGITDGDKIINEYCEIKELEDRKKKTIMRSLRLFSLLLIVINLVISMIKF
ncbi:MAG: site-2 protease family protein [Candidatus Heimdallarchaeota archaeon]|nr:site-2 protease family protein [Candidatus Heimdallarchaeota archaeon]MCK4770473.1 site-2 protease family protein [Candidatus Heimdallarchaeota archaeon]